MWYLDEHSLVIDQGLRLEVDVTMLKYMEDRTSWDSSLHYFKLFTVKNDRRRCIAGITGRAFLAAVATSRVPMLVDFIIYSLSTNAFKAKEGFPVIDFVDRIANFDYTPDKPRELTVKFWNFDKQRVKERRTGNNAIYSAFYGCWSQNDRYRLSMNSNQELCLICQKYGDEYPVKLNGKSVKAKSYTLSWLFNDILRSNAPIDKACRVINLADQGKWALSN